MSYQHVFTAIDTHTAGEPTRIVVAGVPFLGGSMAEKRRRLQEEFDFVRTALMHEPRGHSDMFGAIITEPVTPGASMGVVFMDTGGYLAMCGHGSIGAVTAALETGIVPRREPETQLTMDTPAGPIRARAQVQNGRVVQVAVQNAPSFRVYSKKALDVPSLGNVSVDVSFGGNFFVLVNAAQLQIPLHPENLPTLVRAAMELRRVANERLPVEHPTQPHINTIDLVEIYEDMPGPRKGSRNVVIFGQAQVDRSPCGTGTCAKMAAMYASGQLGPDEPFVNESILGTRFTGRLLGTRKVGPFDAVVPEIAGSAYITGFGQFVVDPEDPLGAGFLLGEKTDFIVK